jgi:hypothetical protein
LGKCSEMRRAVCRLGMIALVNHIEATLSVSWVPRAWRSSRNVMVGCLLASRHEWRSDFTFGVQLLSL